MLKIKAGPLKSPLTFQNALLSLALGKERGGGGAGSKGSKKSEDVLLNSKNGAMWHFSYWTLASGLAY